ncbi:MAG: UbiA-like polyprenyltransferase [Halobacteria archaeon]|nr:UbiA-like polyprenyltransferase [Halobacteria archaeon]
MGTNTRTNTAGRAFQKIKTVAEFTRIEHTLFALPFAFMGTVLATAGMPELMTVFWIFVGLIGGRSASLMINDLIDEPIDAENPRTDDRPLPSGRLSHTEAYILIAVASLVLFFSAWQISLTAFVLSPVILINAYVYPHMKRISSASHLVLGLNGSYAPIGGWIAVRSQGAEVIPYLTSLEYLPAVILGGALIFWYAGFDIIYSLQDLEFDKELGLKSVPTVYGREQAHRISAVLHGVMLVFLIALLLWMLYFTQMNWVIFAGGVLVSGVLLTYEHIIAEHDIGKAFFTVNAVVSGALFFSVVGAAML